MVPAWEKNNCYACSEMPNVHCKCGVKAYRTEKAHDRRKRFAVIVGGNVWAEMGRQQYAGKRNINNKNAPLSQRLVKEVRLVLAENRHYGLAAAYWHHGQLNAVIRQGVHPE